MNLSETANVAHATKLRHEAISKTISVFIWHPIFGLRAGGHMKWQSIINLYLNRNAMHVKTASRLKRFALRKRQTFQLRST
jgi:hypothetical protein